MSNQSISQSTEQNTPIGYTKQPTWVWHCSDASIAAGQISLLALLETALVLVTCIWLAFHYQTQWWLLLSALAAPIILLRSEESKALGVALLRTYNEGSDCEHLSQREILLLLLVVLPITAIATYALAQASPMGYTGWDRWWHTVGLGVFAFAFAFAFAIALLFKIVFGFKFDANFMLGLVFMFGAKNTGGGLMAAFAFAFFLVNAAAFAMGLARSSETKKDFFGIFLMVTVLPVCGMAVGAGIWYRSLCIRIYATLRHPLLGLRNLSHNWQEVLFQVDFTHPPELLPGAGQVEDYFTIAGWRTRLKSADIGDRFLSCLIIPIWYFMALIWRLSLKATLWLWWPLALLLRTPLEDLSAYQVRDHAAVRVYGVSRWLPRLAVLVLVWLGLHYWPDLQVWLGVLEEPQQKILRLLLQYAPPPPGLRLGALLLCSSFSLLLAWQSQCLNIRHEKVFKDEGYLNKLPEERQALFLSRASHLERYYTALVVAFILLGYSTVLWFGQHYYPNETEQLISAWVLAYL